MATVWLPASSLISPTVFLSWLCSALCTLAALLLLKLTSTLQTQSFGTLYVTLILFLPIIHFTNINTGDVIYYYH